MKTFLVRYEYEEEIEANTEKEAREEAFENIMSEVEENNLDVEEIEEEEE